MINEREREQLQKLIFAPEWKVVTRIAQSLINSERSRMKRADDQFNTLMNVAESEGVEKGITRLLQQVNDLAQR